MKAKLHHAIIVSLLCALLGAHLSTAHAQGTAFTYQGQLQNNGSPASGTYNLTFTLFGTNTTGVAIAGPVTNNAVSVTNGLFTVMVDFGPGVFTGATNWLQIGVETNGVSSFTTLTPRQQLTPVPYAIYAENVGTVFASQLTSIGNGNGGSDNYFVGPSGNSTTSGSYNTANGVGALTNNTSGGGNAANGGKALYSNTSGSGNTASGVDALYDNTSGNYNTANGIQALELNVSGTGNTADGAQALLVNTGSYNTADGYKALFLNESGSNNIALGYLAGYNYTGNESGNIDIGNEGVAGENNTIHIGTGQSQTFIAGVITGNGGGLTNLNAAQLTGSSSALGSATPPGNVSLVLNMVWIVPGTFIMGDTSSDPDFGSDEGPQTVVTLTNGFWMGQHPVTQGEYQTVMGSNPSSFTGDLSRPVETVTWINATNFCGTLTQQELSAGRLTAGKPSRRRSTLSNSVADAT